MSPEQFNSAVLAWYDQHGRKDLPWQQNINPYRVWVSEIMLQQTQVSTVLGYFDRFMEALPSVQALAEAPEDEVLHLWTGLGYYTRARNLQKTAQIIMREHGGEFPRSVEALSELPGIGPKSAQRIAFHMLEADREDMLRLADAIRTVKDRVRLCSVCFNVSEDEVCSLCRDERRDRSQICVVEESKDVMAIERTRAFRGLYHVLGGSINPIGGVGPDQLRIRELMTRLSDETVQEIVLATDPNLEGEATATYLARMLRTLGITVTRLASGLPVGGDLEYADEVTLGRAFEGRKLLNA